MKRKMKIKFIENIKIKKIISTIISIIVSICILYNVCYLINTIITRKDYFSVLGISFLTNESDSMKPDLRKNDLVLVKEDEDFKKDDIIAYQVNGKIRINKIINKNINDGEIKYQTKSNQNYYNDIEEISEGKIIGKKITNIGMLGGIKNILETKIATLMTVIILILRISYNKYIFQRQRERKRKKMKNLD